MSSDEPLSEDKESRESKQLCVYTTRTEIGRGGFGVVFKAQHGIDKRWYAIKQVDPVDPVDTEQSPNRVLREVHFLADLNHPHIVRYYDAWLEKPPPSEELSRKNSNKPCLYIRMEWCSGPTLHEWLGQSRLSEQRPVSQTLDWFSQLASAVKYIHNKGLIHRDIKPQNIFFGSSRDGATSVLKIGDFGLAIDVAPSSAGVGATRSIVGTEFYMSPEQPSGHYKNSTDIFSLGLVFLEMVYPFKTDIERYVVFGALRAKRRPDVMNQLDEKMKALISRMTVFEPEKRPTASELVDKLKKMSHLAGQPSRELRVRAFGEVVSLGMGYNELEERFVSGVFVLPRDLIDKYRTETKTENSAFDVTTDDSIEKKRKHFDLSGEASAKLSLGVRSFNIHGAAKYIDDHRRTMNTARLILNYKSRSGTETLSLSDVSDTAYRKDAIIRAKITHVVTCIHYGADAFLLFDRRESNTSSRISAEGELSAALKTFLVSGSIDGSGNLTEDQLERVRSSAVTFYGDVMLDKNPTTFNEAVAVYKNLPTMIKDIKTRPGLSLFGVPQIVTLTPLSHLGLDAPRRRYAQLQDAISTRLNRLTQRSLDLSARLESLIDFEGVYAQLPDEAKEEIDSVRSLTAEHIFSFKLKMSKSLSEFVAGNVTEERVLEEVMDFEKSAYFSGILSDYIDCKERELTALHHYLDQLNQFARPAYNYSSIIGLTLSKDVDCVVAFSLSDILTRKLNAESALLNNTRLADSWCRSSDTAFTTKLKQSIQAFTDLAKSMGHDAASRTRYVYTQSSALPPNVFPAGDDTLGLMVLFEHGEWQAPYCPEAVVKATRQLAEEQIIGSLPNPGPLLVATLVTITNYTTSLAGDGVDVPAQSVPGRHAMQCGHSKLGKCELELRFVWNSLLIRMYLQATGGLVGWVGNEVKCTVSESGRILAEKSATNNGGASLQAGKLNISWTCSKNWHAVMNVEVKEDND